MHVLLVMFPKTLYIIVRLTRIGFFLVFFFLIFCGNGGHKTSDNLGKIEKFITESARPFKIPLNGKKLLRSSIASLFILFFIFFLHFLETF